MKKDNKFCKITLSGLVASGKTAVGRALAQKLNFQFLSIGEFARQYAQNELGLTIIEFQKKCVENPELNIFIDQKFIEKCKLITNNLIIDYRLGFYFIPDAYHIFLNVSDEVAKKRLILNKRHNENENDIQQRNELFKQQFMQAYQLDYTDTANYNLIVNTDLFNTCSETSEFIVEKLKSTKIL